MCSEHQGPWASGCSQHRPLEDKVPGGHGIQVFLCTFPYLEWDVRRILWQSLSNLWQAQQFLACLILTSESSQGSRKAHSHIHTCMHTLMHVCVCMIAHVCAHTQPLEQSLKFPVIQLYLY